MLLKNRSITQWSTPPNTIFKCNVDCALFNNNTNAGYGFCFHDSTGSLISGMSNYSHYALSPTDKCSKVTYFMC